MQYLLCGSVAALEVLPFPPSRQKRYVTAYAGGLASKRRIAYGRIRARFSRGHPNESSSGQGRLGLRGMSPACSGSLSWQRGVGRVCSGPGRAQTSGLRHVPPRGGVGNPHVDDRVRVLQRRLSC
jgi:hypothetical protein